MRGGSRREAAEVKPKQCSDLAGKITDIKRGEGVGRMSPRKESGAERGGDGKGTRSSRQWQTAAEWEVSGLYLTQMGRKAQIDAVNLQ